MYECMYIYYMYLYHYYLLEFLVLFHNVFLQALKLQWREATMTMPFLAHFQKLTSVLCKPSVERYSSLGSNQSHISAKIIIIIIRQKSIIVNIYISMSHELHT